MLETRDFQRVFADARHSGDRWFTVLYRPAAPGSGARLGLAVARKRVRKASARNRIKRLVRESFRHHRGQLGDVDVVVLVKPGIEAADNRTLFESLARHWRRIARSSD